MATVRTHRYTLAPDQVEKFLAQRAELIGQWRAAGLDLVETRLYRLEDGTYLDIWRWASDQVMAKAFDTMGELPLVGTGQRCPVSIHARVSHNLVRPAPRPSSTSHLIWSKTCAAAVDPGRPTQRPAGGPATRSCTCPSAIPRLASTRPQQAANASSASTSLAW